MEERDERKTMMLQALAQMELQPLPAEEEVARTASKKLPLGKIASLGVAFEPIMDLVQSVAGPGVQSQLYKVTIPAGGHLAAFRNGSGFLGAVLGANNQLMGQAVLTPVGAAGAGVAAFHPALLCMAVALSAIEHQLDVFQEKQQAIMDYLIQKDKAQLKANVNFLSGVMEQYKYNWNNERFITSNHGEVLKIRREADASMIQYHKQLLEETKKESMFHLEQDAKSRLNTIKDQLKDYQTALYLFAFASFLDVLLVENFASEHLQDVSAKIEERSLQYRETYTQCYDYIDKYSKTTVESQVLGGVAAVSRFLGNVIRQVPLISESPIDEALLDAGDQLDNMSSGWGEERLEELTAKKDHYAMPFMESIHMIDKLYNSPMELCFDRENLYLLGAE